MEITSIAALLLILFVTPAICFSLPLLLLSKIKISAQSDFRYFAKISILVLAVNYYTISNAACTNLWLFSELNILYFVGLSRLIGCSAESNSWTLGFSPLASFLIKLHLAPFALALVGTYAMKEIEKKAYRNNPNHPNSNIPKLSLENETIIVRVMCWFKKLIDGNLYNYWDSVFSADRGSILMLDVLTNTGDLYSGIYKEWIPEEEKLHSLVITNVLRYYPSKPIVKEGQGDPPASNYKGKEKRKAPLPGKILSARRWKLIPNLGDMLIPSTKIETIHRWEIEPGFELKLFIVDSNDIETQKWWLIFASRYPSIVNKLTFTYAVKADQEFEIKWAEILNWLGDLDIKISPDKLDIKPYQIED